jgi:hypothetical protein
MQQEGRIALAIDALKQGHFISVRDAAKLYNLIHSTLQHRVNGRLAKCNLRPTNYKLTDIEKSTLIQWILSIDQHSLSPRSDSIQQIANLLIEKRSDSS